MEGIKVGDRVRYRWPDGHISHGIVTSVSQVDARVVTDNGATVWAPMEGLEAPSALGQRVYFVVQRSAIKDVTGQLIWLDTTAQSWSKRAARALYESMAIGDEIFRYRLIQRTVIDEEVEG